MGVNKHIEKYLDYYCDFERNLPFAVLLKGQWGCGKTYFIKNYINKRKDKNIVHVSLYGIEDFKGIKEKIIVELIPFIPEKYNGLAGRILENIKKVPKIKDWIPSDIDELLVDIFLKGNKKCIFVFDDLERCVIRIDKLLGYINNFVEFRNQKVVLISDEGKILKSENADKYREIKEKLIGKEFHINSSNDEAIKVFIGDLTDKELLKHSEDIEKILSKILIQSKYDNLRLIQQALSQFEYFLGSFSSKAKENNELFERMFYEFVAIFVEYKKGNIKADDFFKKYPQFFKGSHEDKENPHFLEKYDYGISSWLTCFRPEILGKILQGESLSKDDEIKMISNFENLAEVNMESWQKLWHCYDQSDDDFFRNLNDVIEKWNKKEYHDLYAVLHVFGMFLGFYETGFLQKDKQETLKEGKEYVELLIKQGKFPLVLKEQNDGFSWCDTAYGMQYSGMKNEEWGKLIEFVKEKIEELEESSIKLKIKNELMPVLRNDKGIDGGLELFMNYNFLHYSGNKIAYFQYLDVSEISEIIISGDRSILRSLREVFIKRGKMKSEIEGIEKEVQFLEELKGKLKSDIVEIEKKFGNKITPRSFMLQDFIKEAIKPFITSIMKKVVIIHGCPSDAEKAMNPETRTYDKHWIPWAKKQLEENGVKIRVPLMPDPWQPDYKKFKAEFEKYEVDENTILIGHSCGCAFLVRWLGESKKKISKLILVAPWKIPQGKRNGVDVDFYEYDIDQTIKNRVQKIVMFTADDEEEDGKKSLEIYHQVLDGEVIELKGHGHYTMGDMGTVEFPELLEVVLVK